MGYSPRGRKESDTTEQLHYCYDYPITAPATDPQSYQGRGAVIRIEVIDIANALPSKMISGSRTRLELCSILPERADW